MHMSQKKNMPAIKASDCFPERNRDVKEPLPVISLRLISKTKP